MDLTPIIFLILAILGAPVIGLSLLAIVAIGKWIWSIATTSEEESLTEKLGFKTLKEMVNKE
jgi:hypothetical protein